MSYTENIARSLIEILSHTAGLPTFQLAGHVPNFGFWMGEVRHAIAVVDGYPERHEKMVAAQADFDTNHPDAVRLRKFHDFDYSPPQLAVSSVKAERLRRELIGAINRLIDRCIKEELLTLSQADDLRKLI